MHGKLSPSKSATLEENKTAKKLSEVHSESKIKTSKNIFEIKSEEIPTRFRKRASKPSDSKTKKRVDGKMQVRVKTELAKIVTTPNDKLVKNEH